MTQDSSKNNLDDSDSVDETSLLRGAQFDMNFIKAFVDAARTTLKIQCFTEVIPQKPFIRGTAPTNNVDIAGVIGITSKHFTGSIALCFPATTFLPLISKMLKEQCNQINEEVEDGAGELLNIIFGQAKISLNQKGYELERALPSIVRGDNLKVKHLTPGPTVILPFIAGNLPFHIQIGLDMKANTRK